MTIKLVSLNITLKVMQGIFAYLNIGFQSNSLTTSEFIYLSVIGNSIILSVFLDLGVGIQFIQNYFKQVKIKIVENEDVYALKYLRKHISIFTFIACIQALFISIYAAIFQHNNIVTVNFGLVIITFCVAFFFNYGVLLSRILIARGYVGESVSFQAIGVLTQFVFTVFAFLVDLNLFAFLITLALPNIITAILSLKHLKKKSKLSTSYSNEVASDSIENNFSKRLIPKLQFVQLLQFTIGTLPLLIFTSRAYGVGLIGLLIQWRIFTSVSASLSALNSIEWRELTLAKTNYAKNLVKENKPLIRKLVLAFAISFPAVVIANFTWKYLANSNEKTNLLTWILWILYVLAQVYQWHFYYYLLSMSSYSHIIAGTFIQLFTTITCLLFLSSDFMGTFPLSILIGLILSGLYFQVKSSVLNSINADVDL